MSEIILMCPQLQTTDYVEFDEKSTFQEIMKKIKEKYEDGVLEYLQKFANVQRKGMNLDLITVKLHYIDKRGIRQTLGLQSLVKEIVEKKIDRIYWEPEPIGGFLS